jgi:hypothetical protein
MYAVNYDDGYAIVSATKNYHPVLAVVDHGTYTGEKTGTGQDVLMNEYMVATEAAMNGEISVDKSVWSEYEEVPFEIPAQTKVSDDYNDVLNQYLEDWYMAGYNIYQLREQPENMPDELYEQFCDYARDYDRPDHDYMQCSFIVENPDGFRNDYGPLCSTNWHQLRPYNLALTDTTAKVGCSTIAVAQILKALRQPALMYDWDSMPTYLSPSSSLTLYPEFAFFIRDVRTKIRATTGYADIDIDVKNGLINNYGFNVTVASHNKERVIDSIRSGKPVYMRGADASTGAGHAWVCDGYRYTMTSTEFSLYAIPLGVTEITEMTRVATEIVYLYPYMSTDYFHMNWGWSNSLHNGFYMNNSVSVSSYNFTGDRKNLYFN